MFLSFFIVLLFVSAYIEHVQCSRVTNGGNETLGNVLNNDGNEALGNALDNATNAQSNPETLEEKFNTHEPIIEGDMIMQTDRNALDAVWPGEAGKVSVPYVISPELADRTDTIERAMMMLSEHTCVSFHKRTTEADYLFFSLSNSCASYVGFQGGEQPLYVGPTCSFGNIAHEVMHALGFHHEHTRLDRQDYIQVVQENIQQGSHRNFLMREGKTFGITYDPASIMHYGSLFFTKNGLPTIVAKKHGDKMGQRSYLTISDMRRIRALYKCDEAEKKETVKTDWTPSMINLLHKFRRVKDKHLRIPTEHTN